VEERNPSWGIKENETALHILVQDDRGKSGCKKTPTRSYEKAKDEREFRPKSFLLTDRESVESLRSQTSPGFQQVKNGVRKGNEKGLHEIVLQKKNLVGEPAGCPVAPCPLKGTGRDRYSSGIFERDRSNEGQKLRGVTVEDLKSSGGEFVLGKGA